MMIHTRADPMALVPRVYAIAGTLDPTLRLSEFQRMDQVADSLLWILGLWLRMTLVAKNQSVRPDRGPIQHHRSRRSYHSS
jgi:hypothetical protein